MPYTRAQLSNIMDKRGAGFVPRDKLPYAGRVCETVVRKKVYALEDAAALECYTTLQAAYRDIRDYGVKLADQLNVSTLGADKPTISWRQSVLNYTQRRLSQAVDSIAFMAFARSVTAYAGGYYGRLWMLDMVTQGQVDTQKPRLRSQAVSQAVLQPGLLESVQPDFPTYAMSGQEWRDTFNAELSRAMLKVRKVATTLLVGKTTARSVLNDIGAAVGMDAKNPRGVYFAMQTITRTAILRASNHGAVAAYQAQIPTPLKEATDGWILGVMFVTSMDDRVCPICSRLEGRVYALNDLLGIALLGVPPDSTHPNCRCSLVPILIPTLQQGSDEPPVDTWDEWAYDNGFDNELDWFIQHPKLKSTAL